MGWKCFPWELQRFKTSHKKIKKAETFSILSKNEKSYWIVAITICFVKAKERLLAERWMHVKVLAYLCILGSHCKSQISFVNLDKSIFFLTNTFAGTRGEWQAVCRWRQVETLLPVPVCQAPSVHSSSQLCSSLSLATPNDGLAASSCDKYNFILWQIHFHLVTNTIWSKLKIYPSCALSSAILFNSSRSQVTCC